MQIIKRRNTISYFGLEISLMQQPYRYTIYLKLGHVEYVICLGKMAHKHFTKAAQSQAKYLQYLTTKEVV